jgi:hypothetical protein
VAQASFILSDPAGPGEAASRRDETIRRRWRWVLIVLVVLGALFRFAQYASDRSYWHDEAFLVLNIFQKDAGQLMGPLNAAPESPQAAPPLFLLAQRGVYLGLGGSEFAMRLIPLGLGVAALVLFALLAWRWLGPVAATFAVGLFACSDRLIWHAVEAKQYSGDAFFAVLLLWLAMRKPGAGPMRRLWTCSIVAAGAMWMSHPVVFVFAGISLSLLPEFLQWRRIGKWVLGNVPAVISFGALYALSIRVQESVTLNDYWADRFLNWGHPLQWPVWGIGQALKLFDYPYTNWGWFILLLCVLACIYGWGQKRRDLVLLFSPILLVLGAAMAHAYPFGGHRLTVFLAPALFLGAGWGVEALMQWRPIHRKPAAGALILAGAAIAFGLGMAVYHLARPRTRDHLRPAIAFVREHYQSGDGLVVLNRAEFLCYWRPMPTPCVVVPQDAPIDPEAIPTSWKRFWVIGDRTDNHDRQRWEAWLQQPRAAAWKQAKGSFHNREAAAMLYAAPTGR